jgi:hypothetical protein
VDLPSKPTNTSLPFHFDKHAKPFLNYRPLASKTASLQCFAQENLIAIKTGPHSYSLSAFERNITQWQEKSIGEVYSLMTTAGLLPLLPASRNGPDGLDRAEAFWNSFSCDRTIAIFGHFQLSFSAKSRWVPVFPVRSRGSRPAISASRSIRKDFRYIFLTPRRETVPDAVYLSSL